MIPGDPATPLTRPTAMQLLSDIFLKQQAFWIDHATLLIPSPHAESGGMYTLCSDLNAGLTVTLTGLTGGRSLPLTLGGALIPAQLARFPQLKTGYTALRLPTNLQAADYQALLRGQLAVSIQRADGTLTYATGVQQAGVLDDLYAYDGPLGFVPHAVGTLPEVRVWAPTAQSVKLQLFQAAADTTPALLVPMREQNGLWAASIDRRWTGCCYLFAVRVYAPATRTIAEHIVTDPYSIDLAINGTKSRLTDLDSPHTKPVGWDGDRAPALARVNDLSMYELHVRDFSVGDTTVPEEHRGTYLAFTDAGSDGMRHLRALAGAGLKAVHLLPTFHFNSVNEDKSTWKATGDLSGYPPDGEQQQAAVAAVQSEDAYNWGYDPDHYLAPEGSYAVDPDNRVFEYRQMVQALHRSGLRVIQDVVFNHTSGFGEASNSILDRIVPNYYTRLDADGVLETSSCCANTATEHRMMGKLQEDAIVWAAKKYKIDGFRFDIMSFTFMSNLKAIQQALRQLTLEKDGVDGSKIYIYGEGFDFGETANGALGVNASQGNLYGNGIGSFNDRLRDGVRGGGPFDDGRIQGFATGLFTDASRYTSESTAPNDQKATLLHRTDWIRAGLAGNLRDYTFTDSTGKQVNGGQLDYGGQPVGYTASPVEAVNYVSVHDNQILFDALQLKSAEGDTAAMRARRQVLAISLVALGQGVPFFAAADDLLRSKSMDGNSYDSGDWFNKIDWTGGSNNWGIGLPIAKENRAHWAMEEPVLANAALRPTSDEIGFAAAVFQDFLRIRESSSLFRMATFAEVQRNLSFLNVGPDQIPGLIVMELNAHGGAYGPYGHVLVVWNATLAPKIFTSAQLAGLPLTLHPVQADGADGAAQEASFDVKTGAATVPALTAAVFVSVRET